MTVNRFCSSGLQAIALAAQRIISGEASVLAAGGLESISLVQDGRSVSVHDDWIVEHAVAEKRFAAGELVADKQILDDPADLLAVHEIKTGPPAIPT